MYSSSIINLFTTLLVLSFVFVSCGDDPASSEEEPPEPPTFENFEPDVSYFEGDIPSDSPANIASAYAQSVANLSQTGANYSLHFSEMSEDNASFEDGKWIWEYTNNMGFTVVIESEERADAIHWSMTWSYEGGEENVEDYTMVEGWVAHDGSSGSWQFNTVDEETGEHDPLMVTEWSWESETAGSITTSYYNEGTLATSFTFEQDGDDFYINLESTSDDSNLYIYWTEGGGGYYQEGENESNRQCWDSNYVEVECS